MDSPPHWSRLKYLNINMMDWLNILYRHWGCTPMAAVIISPHISCHPRINCNNFGDPLTLVPISKCWHANKLTNMVNIPLAVSSAAKLCVSVLETREKALCSALSTTVASIWLSVVWSSVSLLCSCLYFQISALFFCLLTAVRRIRSGVKLLQTNLSCCFTLKAFHRHTSGILLLGFCAIRSDQISLARKCSYCGLWLTQQGKHLCLIVGCNLRPSAYCESPQMVEMAADLGKWMFSS